jgi:hypothetical protein
MNSCLTCRGDLTDWRPLDANQQREQGKSHWRSCRTCGHTETTLLLGETLLEWKAAPFTDAQLAYLNEWLKRVDWKEVFRESMGPSSLEEEK